MYWDRHLDDRFMEYNKAIIDGDTALSNKIFNEHLLEPLKRLVDATLHNYCNYDSVSESYTNIRYMLLGKVILIMNQYDSSKGAKSFSYFGTVLKNELLTLNMAAYSKAKKTVYLDATGEDDSYVDNDIRYADNTEIDLKIAKDNAERYHKQVDFYRDNIQYTNAVKKELVIKYIHDVITRPEVIDDTPNIHTKRYIKNKVKELAKLENKGFTDKEIDRAFVKLLRIHMEINKGIYKKDKNLKEKFNQFIEDEDEFQGMYNV